MKSSLFTILVLSLALFSPIVLTAGDTLNNNEVTFTGTILSVLDNGQGGGTLFVSVNQTELRVIVNEKTDVEDKDGKEIDISSLKKDVSVKITGKFSASGILASEVVVLSPAPASNTFQVCGHITDIRAADKTLIVTLVGITVVVDGATKIDWDGKAVPPANLRMGLEICAKGDIKDSTWTATDISILSTEKRMDTVRFEGTIAKINKEGDTIKTIEFAVTGTEVKGQIVNVGPGTKIFGTPAVGALAEVKGVLNSDLTISASQIHMLASLEIKPDERKLKVGDKTTFTVKLRETATVATKVDLKVDDKTVVSEPPASVTIPAGSKSAEFAVTALKIGTAKLTATLGTETATAMVYVGTLSDDDTERPDKELYMVFAPSHIKMGANDTRDVVLLIKPPQEKPTKVAFTFDNKVLDAPQTSELGAGAASYKVTIRSKSVSAPVSTTVVVTLEGNPANGPKAELLIEVGEKDKK